MHETVSSKHGYYRLERHNNILVATLKGGWNQDTARAFCRDFKAEAAPLVDARWGHLVYLADWEMGVPGVDAIIKELVFWCIEHHLTHAAHVYGDNAITHYYVDQIVEERDKVFIKRVFKDDRLAIQWLSEQGYTLQK